MNTDKSRLDWLERNGMPFRAIYDRVSKEWYDYRFDDSKSLRDLIDTESGPLPSDWLPIEAAVSSKPALVSFVDGSVDAGWFDGSAWWSKVGRRIYPTHWQPLPEGPM